MTGSKQPVRVLVDALVLKPGLGGLRTYARELVRVLSLPEHDLLVSVLTSMPEEVAQQGVNCLRAPDRTRSYPYRVAWREMRLSRVACSIRAQVVLTINIELPLRRMATPSVLIVQDVGPLVAPALYTRGRWLRYACLLPHTCRSASRVVCSSATSLGQLHGAVGVDLGKCEVIGMAPAATARRPRHPRHGRPYVLYVGAMLPHKNVATLLQAFSDPSWLPDHELQLAGHMSDSEAARFHALVDRLGVAQRVRHHGYVTDADLGTLYGAADVVAFPTLFEGFGLPLLEAMLAGSPVVASAIPVLREIGGDGAIWVAQPHDPQSWRTAIETTVTLGPSARAEIVEAAYLHASGYRWSEVGERFARLLHSLAASSRDTHTGGGRTRDTNAKGWGHDVVAN